MGSGDSFGYNIIQTNGTLINDEHIRLFKAYKVSVGVSIDGPGELNDVRWHGTLEQDPRGHRQERAGDRAPVSRGLSAEPHRHAAPRQCRGGPAARSCSVGFTSWSEWAYVRVRLHLLESESEAVRAKYALTVEENVAALLGIAALRRNLKSLEFDLFADMRRMLLGQDESSACVWNACDPYTTQAVQGVEGHGQRSNCGRTNKDGIDFVKGDKPGYERYLALYATPQQAGGCQRLPLLSDVQRAVPRDRDRW